MTNNPLASYEAFDGLRGGAMTSPTPVSPEHFPSRATGWGVLESSVSNAEALWRAFAAARGHRVIDEPAWLVVDAGNDIGGTRVILRGPVTGAVQRASLNRLVESARRPVVVEDSFATVNLHAQGLVPGSLSVMGAGPLTLDAVPTEERPDITVRRVAGHEGRLLEAERIVVEGFPLTTYQPYQPGRLLPAGLLQMPHISVFVADFLGTPSGACMTVKDTHGVGGIYWVAVLPERRSAGIGRALMLAAMRELAGLPMVLCATPQGAPLYLKLGFETALESTYWGRHPT
ncbi:MAG: GNAT family N-acetyltransferase [Actinobacteria bacterium]|nr:GNAT family N-acetyltransferase [Actinomycetota bacterium]